MRISEEEQAATPPPKKKKKKYIYIYIYICRNTKTKDTTLAAKQQHEPKHSNKRRNNKPQRPERNHRIH